MSSFEALVPWFSSGLNRDILNSIIFNCSVIGIFPKNGNVPKLSQYINKENQHMKINKHALLMAFVQQSLCSMLNFPRITAIFNLHS